MTVKHVYSGSEGKLCIQSHYVAIVEAQKTVEVYQLGDIDCAECLRRMAEKHEALGVEFRARLAALSPGHSEEHPPIPVEEVGWVKCRVYDAVCLNPAYCDSHGACCAGDPDCVPSDRGGAS